MSDENAFGVEKNYQLIFECCLEGIIFGDPEGAIYQANPSACRMLGYSEEELRNIGRNGIVNPSDIKVQNALKEREATGQILTELNLIRKDGTEFPVEISSRIFSHPDGKQRTYFIFRDISEKVRIRQGLNDAMDLIGESERRFRGLIQHLTDVILLINPEWKIVYASPSIEKVTGYTPEERLGSTSLEWIHPDDVPAVLQNAQNLMEKGIEKRIEIRTRHKTKGWIWTETIASNFLDDPSINAIVVNYRDIDDRKKAEEAHQLSESRYRAFASNLPNGIVNLFDKDLRYVLVEGEELKKLEVTKEQLEGKTVYEIWPEEVLRVAVPYYKACLEGKHNVFELENHGQIYEARTVPIANDKGEIVMGMGMFQNISERKKIEKELKEINASKDKLFSIISHDLRSPFTALLGLSEYLANQSDNLSAEEIQSCATSLHFSAKGLLTLLDDLLQWSRFKTGKIIYKPETFFVNDLIVHALSVFKSNAKKKNIEIHFEPSEGIKVFADHYMADTVLRNFLSNAVKFTKRGGKIEVRASLKMDMAEISVSDNGVGINKRNLEMLFKIGEQVSTRGTEDEAGTGLGLALCKEFVEINNGTLIIDSKPGVGTTATFTLPAV